MITPLAGFHRTTAWIAFMCLSPMLFGGVNVWTGNGPDGGSINSLAADPTAQNILYAGTVGAGVFKSTNGGGWAAASTGFPYTNTQVMALAVDPTSPLTVYAGTSRGMFKSTDGGALWAAAMNGLPNTTVTKLAMDPVDPLTLYAGLSSGGVYKSVNGADNWTVASTGLPSGQVRALIADPVDHLTLYSAAGNSLFKTIDGGVNWVDTDNGPAQESA